MLIISLTQDDKEKEVTIPTDWEDMTVEYYCGIYKIIDNHRKKAELRDKARGEKNEKNKENQENFFDITKDLELKHLKRSDVLRMNKELFQYLTKVSDEEMEYIDLEQAYNVLGAVDVLREEYKPKGTDSFIFEEEEYFFPSEYLKRNTFGDYIESTQLDMYIDSMTHGRLDALPEQMAILCRRIDEEYDDDKIEEKAEKFKKLTMDVIWEFSFFLTARCRKLTNLLQTYSEEREAVEALYEEK